MNSSSIAAVAVFAASSLPLFADPVETRIFPTENFGPDHDFGTSVAVDGNFAVVGALGDGDDGIPSNETTFGAAIVFDVTTGNQLRKFVPDNPVHGSELGTSVGISGIHAIATARSASDGLVYIFNVTNGNQLHELKPDSDEDGNPDEPFGDFGEVAAISGNFAIVGAPMEDWDEGNDGAAYVYDVTTGAQIHRLVPTDTVFNAKFGTAVALSGNFALVTAQGNDAAYLFDLTSGAQVRKFEPADPVSDTAFGGAAALSGTFAAVGASLDDEAGDSNGAVYLFDTSSGNQVRKLLGTVAGAGFGSAVSISDTRILVGAPGTNAAYVHALASGAELDEVTPSDVGVLDFFGSTVGMSGGTAIVGAPLKDGFTGAAYLYKELTGSSGGGDDDPPPTTQPAPPALNFVAFSKFSRKIKKFKKKAKKARRAGKTKKARKMKKKLRKFKKKRRRLF